MFNNWDEILKYFIFKYIFNNSMGVIGIYEIVFEFGLGNVLDGEERNLNIMKEISVIVV